VRSPKAYLSAVVTRLCLDGSPQSVTTLDVAEGRIRAIRLVLNPEKLGSVPHVEQSEKEDPE